VVARERARRFRLPGEAVTHRLTADRSVRLAVTATTAVLLLALALGVEAGWVSSIDQLAVDHVMLGVKAGQQSSSGWLSAFPIFHPEQHPQHVVVAALTYVVTFPASLVPAALLVGLSLLAIYRRGRDHRYAVAFGVLFAAANIVEVAGKGLVARPPLDLHSPLGAWLRLRTFDATFPSGHATRALLVAAALAICLPRIQGLLYAWVGAVAVLLVVAGAHAPSDVAGGLLLGLLCLGALKAWHGETCGGSAEPGVSRAWTRVPNRARVGRRSPPM
jgi:membrane-associated phospholipid phosphatase